MFFQPRCFGCYDTEYLQTVTVNICPAPPPIFQLLTTRKKIGTELNAEQVLSVSSCCQHLWHKYTANNSKNMLSLRQVHFALNEVFWGNLTGLAVCSHNKTKKLTLPPSIISLVPRVCCTVCLGCLVTFLPLSKQWNIFAPIHDLHTKWKAVCDRSS